MNNAEFIKFQNNEEHTIKLDFDDPLIKDGQYGPSNLYSGTRDSKDVKFYASAGLHQEIQAQKLKKGSVLTIKKIIKPGEDYSIFIVNGSNSKHNVYANTDSVPSPKPIEKPKSSNVDDVDFLKTKIKEIDDRVKKLESETIPF